MQIDLLLSELKKYLFSVGYRPTAKPQEQSALDEARDNLGAAIIQLIDYKIIHALDVRRKTISHTRERIADAMNNNMKHMTSSVKALGALYAAPRPLSDRATPEEVKEWLEVYKKWYAHERADGMTIE